MPHRLLRTLARVGRWPRIAAALACLLLAAVSALESTHRTAAARAPGPTTGPVVVAVRALPAGHVLGRHDLTTVRAPTSTRPAGAYAAVGPLVGRRLAGAVTVHEPLTPTRFVGTDLAAGLGDGVVAVAILVGADVVDLVHPGDRVDVLAVVSPDAGGLAGEDDPTGTAGRGRDSPGTGTTRDQGNDAKAGGSRAGGSKADGSNAGGATDSADGAEVVASRARVLAVRDGAAGDDGTSGTQLVIATSREVGVRIAALRVSRMFTAVVDTP